MARHYDMGNPLGRERARADMLERERDEAQAEIARLVDSMNRRAFLLADARRGRDESEARADTLHNALGRLARAVDRVTLARMDEGTHGRYEAAWDVMQDAANEARAVLENVGTVDAYGLLADVSRAARPVVNRLWESGENQAAEVIRLGEVLDRIDVALAERR